MDQQCDGSACQTLNTRPPGISLYLLLVAGQQSRAPEQLAQEQAMASAAHLQGCLWQLHGGRRGQQAQARCQQHQWLRGWAGLVWGVWDTRGHHGLCQVQHRLRAAPSSAPTQRCGGSHASWGSVQPSWPPAGHLSQLQAQASSEAAGSELPTGMSSCVHTQLPSTGSAQPVLQEAAPAQRAAHAARSCPAARRPGTGACEMPGWLPAQQQRGMDRRPESAAPGPAPVPTA